MDFSLTDDQRAFAESAQTLFADYCNDDQLRAHDASGQPFMRGLWQQCAETGLLGMTVPEEAGGLSLGMTELMAVLEQQGRALALVPLWEQQLALATLARFGDSSAHQDIIAAALRGERLVTLSLAGLVASQARLQVTQDGAALRLDGCVPAVPLGAEADYALLAAERDGTPCVVLVDLSNAEIMRTAGVSQHHQSIADLNFERVRVDASACFASDALRWLEPRAIACLAALQVGVSARQLERTVEYISERRQFERVIGSFQLVAGQMADGYIAVQALRSSLCQLVYRLDAGQGALPQGWATRFLACETGHRVGHMAQHVHGGIGVDVTFPIHRFLYWSRVLGLALGGAEHNLAKLGDWLANHDTLGWKYDHAEDQTV
jgi:alkylation response protein AidB-like acyl-CoA dehydrogenase